MAPSWDDLLAAIALVLVFEGLMPFLAPDALKRTLLQLVQLDERVLRTIGLVSMLVGLALLALVR